MIKSPIAVAILLVGLLHVDVVRARADHCYSDWFVHEVTPSSPEVWRIGEMRAISWRWGFACRPVGSFEVSISRDKGEYETVSIVEGSTGTYDIPIEFTWQVVGPTASHIVFRIRNNIPEAVPSYSAPIEITGPVVTAPTSWGSLKGRFR